MKAFRAVGAAGLMGMLAGLGGCARDVPTTTEIIPATHQTPAAEQGEAAELEATDDTDAPRTVDYFPITPGMRWEYDITYTIAIGGPNKATAIAEVTGEETIQGKTYSKLVADVRGTPVDSLRTTYYRHGEDGTFKIDGQEIDKGERLSFPPTLEIGTKWKGGSSDGPYEAEVTAREEITCPAGTFDCLRITTRTRNLYGSTVENQWFAKDVGMVKQTNQGALVSSELVLRSFTAATDE